MCQLTMAMLSCDVFPSQRAECCCRYPTSWPVKSLPPCSHCRCRGTGVIREDPLEFAWRPEQRPALHATPAAAELHSGESHQVSSAAILQAHTAEQLVASSSSGRGSMGGSIGGSMGGSGSSSSVDEQSANGVAGGRAGRGSRAAAAVPALKQSSSSNSRSGGNGLPAAGSMAAPLPTGQQSLAHEQRLEEMLSRLQALGWRRVDVCFAGAALPFLAHQHIQYQRVINWPGQTTVKHLALQLAAMEQLREQRVMQGQQEAAGQPAVMEQPQEQEQAMQGWPAAAAGQQQGEFPAVHRAAEGQ